MGHGDRALGVFQVNNAIPRLGHTAGAVIGARKCARPPTGFLSRRLAQCCLAPAPAETSRPSPEEPWHFRTTRSTTCLPTLCFHGRLGEACPAFASRQAGCDACSRLRLRAGRGDPTRRARGRFRARSRRSCLNPRKGRGALLWSCLGAERGQGFARPVFVFVNLMRVQEAKSPEGPDE